MKSENEIKKLYKNAGLDNLWVERYNDGNGFEHENWYPSYKVMIKSMMEKYGWTLTEAQNVAKKECRKEHPPFTAEKQIELIKLLGNVRDYTVEIDKFKGIYYIGCRSAGSNDKFWGSSDTFEYAIAELVNEIWLSLTGEEKQQVKEIIE